MIPDQIRQEILIPFGIEECLPLGSGFSGAQVYRCEGRQKFALRRWPKETNSQRIYHIHQTVQHAAQLTVLFPKYAASPLTGQTLWKSPNGYLWDLNQWVEGEPLPHDASVETIAGAAKGLSEVHGVLRQQGIWKQPSKSIARRVEHLEQINKWLPSVLNIDVGGRFPHEIASILAEAQDLLRKRWADASRRISHSLAPIRHQIFVCHHVLRDIHREHGLHMGGELRGFIDFDAIAIDTPYVDLARWTSSFLAYDQDPQGTIHTTVAAYQPADPLPYGTDARTLVYSLAEASAWISLLNWMKWLVFESRQFPNSQRVAVRLRRLVDSRNHSQL